MPGRRRMGCEADQVVGLDQVGSDPACAQAFQAGPAVPVVEEQAQARQLRRP